MIEVVVTLLAVVVVDAIVVTVVVLSDEDSDSVIESVFEVVVVRILVVGIVTLGVVVDDVVVEEAEVVDVAVVVVVVVTDVELGVVTDILLSLFPQAHSVSDNANTRKIFVLIFKVIILPSSICLFDLSLMRKVEQIM